MNESRTSLSDRREILAMLDVSRAVVRGGSVSDILDRIAAAAAGVVAGADRASIILVEGRHRRFRLAGSHGLSAGYVDLLSTGEAKLKPGEGPSGVAYSAGSAVIVDDVETDPLIERWAWRDIAFEEGYRGIVSLPLAPHGRVVGTLNLYRTAPGPWNSDDVQLLGFFAEHAANAVRTAQLLDQRLKQVDALRLLVRALQAQSHEHANRLHAISGLLALDLIDDAKQLLTTLEGLHVGTSDAVAERVRVPIVAALALAETAIAAQRGIKMSLSEDSRLTRLPSTLSDTQLVTILGNLLDNAFDAASAAPSDAREVYLRVTDAGADTLLEVGNRGDAPPDAGAGLFDRGFSLKPGHAGVGLSLVRDAVDAAMGDIEIAHRDGWTTFRVFVPNDEAR
ncbi:MAG TPA: GAF domain-containing protein [Gemmatimonadaceae bacterium]|nr:GAF domain-containing protein [Gemmatimonadaceae bacterium]